jgi:predicted ATPase/DNA-binding CsgD family transcriptional regulator
VPNNLPLQLSSFVGRAAELGEVARLLSDHRLLTLTGAGGCGKTRLAVRAASETLERYPDGAWWVELAPLSDERLLGAAIAQSLGVRSLPGMSELQAAGAYLASRRALIVLDNCEHLAQACAEAAETLLGAAPDLAVLATSRAPLAASGETEWRVPSLSLPATGDEENGASDAVALFTERATNARPDLALGAADADSVAAICTELDGLPLAIELAAARARILSVEQIAAELSDRFRLLSGGPRTAIDRLKTMRASVDWSHGLLSEAERALFRRLAVFAGGLTPESVDEICAGEGIEREAVLDLLASLVDQSLVLAEQTEAGVRYRLLETVRQYGLERLAEAGEEGSIRARHRDHFLALAEQAGPHLETGRQLEFLQLLDPEAANLATAIEFALDSDPALALRFSAALYRWWGARGRFAEAELACSRSLEACGDAEPGLRARVLQCRAWVATTAGEFEAAGAHATEALALADEVGDQATAARARCQLGRTMMYASPRAGRAELERAVELARSAGDDWALVEAQQHIADAYYFQGDHRQSARAREEVVELAERLGDPLQVARRWWEVAWIAVPDGRLVEAREAAERTREAVDAVGEPLFEALADTELGIIDFFEGEPERALERMNRRLEPAITQGAGLVVPVLLTMIASAELTLGRLDEARGRLEGVVPLVEGRWGYIASWALVWLAETLRLQADDAAEPTARRAQTIGEELGSRFLATWARLTLARIAAARGEWTAAREHALAHLDVCVEGGHATNVPPCLDALAEVAGGLGADEDAVRLLAAAERARAEIGIVRVPPEAAHWAAIDSGLREALGDEGYDAARAQGAEMSTEDALEWARRMRGPRRRPPGGWESLTSTEGRVAELVAGGLTNPQIAERMFVSPGTVKTHVTHIFRKLGLHSRTELAAQAVERRKAEA